ncbi:excisionase family DNA-binding protein [Cetobacterium sp.]|uniref:excisionase family DNA-binding protein n=1 Tax=Cetobacterium sp. TaxID=2071632 RepID=UPI0025B8C874|nr:excisionase family DNA-binding protein [Cetobacterium sp.]
MKNSFIREHLNRKNSFISVKELANSLLVSKKTIYRMIKDKKIISIKLGSYYAIKVSSVKKLIQEVIV